MLLQTINLNIRNATDLDAEFVAKVQTNESVQKYTGGVLVSFEDTFDCIKKQPQVLDNFYIIEQKETNDSIGIVAIVQNSNLSEYGTEDEILISLLPDFQGNRYGPETLSAFKDFWLTSKSVERMLVTVIPENMASVSMLKKEGFVFVKEYEESCSLRHVYKYERNHT